MTNSKKIEDIKQELNSVPEEPGVYLWKNYSNEVIYVGKAKRLRSRMRQYVNLQDSRKKIPLLVDNIFSFEYVVVHNEQEALILEKQLIDQHSPYFNADFKDDKSYPFIAVTKGDYFPAIKYTREKHNSHTIYYGPFTDSHAARSLAEIVRKVIPICSTRCNNWKRLNAQIEKLSDDEEVNSFLYSLTDKKPCFDCHVGLGPGPCCNNITQKEYLENVEKVERFLAGNRSSLFEEINMEIKKASDELNFEHAARLQSRLSLIGNLSSSQHIVSKININADIIGVYREETIAGVYIIVVREGRIINTNELILNRGLDVSNEDLLHMLILRYYDQTTSIPHEIIMSDFPEDQDSLSLWLTQKLSSKHGAKVRFIVPKKADRKRYLDLANSNSKHTLMRYKARYNYEDTRRNNALLELESALSMAVSPLRIECFDISTNHGTYTVASMVVFTNASPDKANYRRFKIKTKLTEANDFLCMKEVLKRRYCQERLNDSKFGKKPDLILLDGGKPQLSAAIEVFNEIGFNWEKEGVCLAGLEKNDEEIVMPIIQNSNIDYHEIVLPDGAASLYLIKHVRDESHRFAIEFHRKLRSKGMTKSILDEVAGLGPVRQKKILKSMGGFKKLCNASLAEIQDAKVLPVDIAEELYAVLKQYSNKKQNELY